MAKVAGTVVRPRAALDVRARQQGHERHGDRHGDVPAACRITVSGTATVGRQARQAATPSKRTLRKAGSARMRVTLPAKARLALAAPAPRRSSA